MFVVRTLLVCVLFTGPGLKASSRVFVVLLIAGSTGIRFGGFGLKKLRDRRFHPAEVWGVGTTVYDRSEAF